MYNFALYFELAFLMMKYFFVSILVVWAVIFKCLLSRQIISFRNSEYQYSVVRLFAPGDVRQAYGALS